MATHPVPLPPAKTGSRKSIYRVRKGVAERAEVGLEKTIIGAGWFTLDACFRKGVETIENLATPSEDQPPRYNVVCIPLTDPAGSTP